MVDHAGISNRERVTEGFSPEQRLHLDETFTLKEERKKNASLFLLPIIF